MDALVQWFDENRCFFIGFGAGVVTTLLVLGAVVGIFYFRLWQLCKRTARSQADEEAAVSEREYAALINDSAAASDGSNGASPTVGVAAFGEKSPYMTTELDTETFQQLWGRYPTAATEEFTVLTEDGLVSWLEQHNIHCMASGSLDGVTKYYLYAKESSSGSLHLTELIIQEHSRHVTMTVKSEGKKSAANYVDYFFVVVSSFITHTVDLE